MTSMPIDELRRIVGPQGWSSDPVELEPHLTEWRGAVRGKTPIMLSPATPEEVASIVRVCANQNVGIVPQGGNTGLCGGAIPDSSGEQVLLSLSRLNRIRSIDARNYSMVVDAGCILADVQAKARDVNRLFALSLAAEGSCQIGGNLSTNAGGINVIRYGTARQQVLGLEVVLADGQIWNGLRSLQKDTAGYDLKQLFIGSEGTLGIITGATLRLFPQPKDTVTVLVAIASANHAVDLLARTREVLSNRILAFELISNRAMDFVGRHITDFSPPFDNAHDWYALVEVDVDGERDLLDKTFLGAIDDGIAADAIIAKSGVEARRFWRIRHAISEAQKFEGLSLKHDIAVPIAAIGEFLRLAQIAIERVMPSARPVVFGHIGDGNLHYNITQPAGSDSAKFLAGGEEISGEIFSIVSGLGGSISAEHGIGVLKRDLLRQYRGGTELELMRTIKRALDPGNLLNPGKVI